MRLSEAVVEAVPASMLHHVPDRFEVIGDIAVITLPEPLLPYQDAISQAIRNQRHNITTVLRRIAKREGDSRVAGYVPITGSKTTTVCREGGFSYRVDLAQAFFTTRLAGERQRIASLICQGEQVFVPFAGVGPFVIPAAAKGAEVVALEMNPHACTLLKENIRLNRLQIAPAVIRGDTLTADSLFRCRFDRAIIPTPYGLNTAFGPVKKVVRAGGVIHYYTFQNRSQAEVLIDIFEKSGCTVTRCHRCGNVAPSVSRWVYDLKIEA